jgi:capsular polysaccharide biosynthesis protein
MTRDWSTLTWGEKTWGERAQTVLCMAIAFVVGLAMFLGVVLLLGQIMDVQTQRLADHERCLKKATNGYEIRECH